MTIPYIDTDVIIRLLTGDDPVKQRAARALFKQVEVGTLTVAAPVTVIADAVFVLSSPRLYALDRATVATTLSALVRLPGFQIHDRVTVLYALAIYGSENLDFGDCMIAASMRHSFATELFSYDRGFDRLTWITRREPPAEDEEPVDD